MAWRVLDITQKVRYTPNMVDVALIERVNALSATDRLDLIGAVWETLSPVEVPITEVEKSLLDARLADLEKKPDDQSPWSEVQARLLRLLP